MQLGCSQEVEQKTRTKGSRLFEDKVLVIFQSEICLVGGEARVAKGEVRCKGQFRIVREGLKGEER